MKRFAGGPEIIALIDDEFEEPLDKRPVLLRHADGVREWLDVGPLSVAAVATERPPSYYDSNEVWKNLRMNATSRLRWSTLNEIRNATRFSVLVHSIGGKVHLGKILSHLADDLNDSGSTTAFVRDASSAAGDFITHIPNWIMLRNGKWMIHHSAHEEDDTPVQSINPGLVEHLAAEDRKKWLRKVERKVRLPANETEEKDWRRRHEDETRELKRFFENAIPIASLRHHIHFLVDQMLEEPYATELEWTGAQLRNFFGLRNIKELTDTPADMAHAFEEHTGLSLDARDMEPIRNFFDQ